MADSQPCTSGLGKTTAVPNCQRVFANKSCKHFGAIYDTHLTCALCRESFGQVCTEDEPCCRCCHWDKAIWVKWRKSRPALVLGRMTGPGQMVGLEIDLRFSPGTVIGIGMATEIRTVIGSGILIGIGTQLVLGSRGSHHL